MVTPRLQLLNCFWLLLPVFAWNAVFASRLPQAGFKSDAGVPRIYRPEAAWSRSAAGLLAPAYTPLIWRAGIALVGASWPYALLSLLFVGVHVYHNILTHGLP